jgi:hypothetical protein
MLSKIGRFASVDPFPSGGRVEESQTWNRYGYVKNDPINFSDPDGQDPVNIFERVNELNGNPCVEGVDGFVHCPAPPESVLIVDREADALQQGLWGSPTIAFDSLRPPPDLNELEKKAETLRQISKKVNEAMRAVRCAVQVPGGMSYDRCMNPESYPTSPGIPPRM